MTTPTAPAQARTRAIGQSVTNVQDGVGVTGETSRACRPSARSSRYRDVRAAIHFLCEAFVFERHAVHEDGEGDLTRAELRPGDDFILPTERGAARRAWERAPPSCHRRRSGRARPRPRGGRHGTPVGRSVANDVMGGVPPDPARLARPPDPGLGRRVWVEVERTVEAPMERMWALLRDYRVARPRLLTEHFSDYAVQERGEGAGTVIEYRLRVGRHHGRHVLAVQEPVPGRMLRDRDRTSALVSTWTLTPGGEGERTVIRLAVALRDPQISGWLARLRARRALRRLCGQLLERVDAELGGQQSPTWR